MMLDFLGKPLLVKPGFRRLGSLQPPGFDQADRRELGRLRIRKKLQRLFRILNRDPKRSLSSESSHALSRAHVNGGIYG